MSEARHGTTGGVGPRHRPPSGLSTRGRRNASKIQNDLGTCGFCNLWTPRWARWTTTPEKSCQAQTAAPAPDTPGSARRPQPRRRSPERLPAGPASARTPRSERGARRARRGACARGRAGVGAAREPRTASARPTSLSMALRPGAPGGHAAGAGRPAGAGPRRSAVVLPRPRGLPASAPAAGRPAGAAVCGSRRCHGDGRCPAWTGSLRRRPALPPEPRPPRPPGEPAPEGGKPELGATEPQLSPRDCVPPRSP